MIQAMDGPGSTSNGAPSDSALVQRYRSGDESAFSELVKRYEKDLFHYLLKFLGERATAEDVTQDAFMQVHARAGDFDARRAFRPWLFAIAANRARDILRSRRRQPATAQQQFDEHDAPIDRIEAVDAMPELPLEREETREAVQQAVATIPEALREVLLLSYFHEFSHKEIASIQQVPVGTVKSRLHAAIGYFTRAWREGKR
jgi:RNA polymerase sigma-70 factor (ECF subfamily)